jgi:hypothetical protein
MNNVRAVAIAALAGLAACSHADYGVGGQRFHSYEDARAHVRAFNEQQLAEIQPLPAPIAGPATVVFPTRGQLENAAREDFPYMSDREVQQFVELQVGDRLWARSIERRNIFESVRPMEAQSPDGIPMQPNGYLIWYEPVHVGKHRGTDVHIVASGQAQRTKIFDGSRPVDPKEYASRLLQAIEDYVRAHPATV